MRSHARPYRSAISYFTFFPLFPHCPDLNYGKEEAETNLLGARTKKSLRYSSTTPAERGWQAVFKRSLILLFPVSASYYWLLLLEPAYFTRIWVCLHLLELVSIYFLEVGRLQTGSRLSTPVQPGTIVPKGRVMHLGSPYGFRTGGTVASIMSLAFWSLGCQKRPSSTPDTGLSAATMPAPPTIAIPALYTATGSLADLLLGLPALQLQERIDWYHPPGATNQEPVNPLVVILYAHPIPGISQAERFPAIEASIRIVNHLAPVLSGVYIEGLPNTQKVGSYSDATGEEALKFLHDEPPSDANECQRSEIRVLATFLSPRVPVYGAESPVGYPALIEASRQQRLLSVGAANVPIQKVRAWYRRGAPLERRIQGGRIIFTDEVLEWNSVEVDGLRALESLTARINNDAADAAADPISARARAAFIANLPPGSAVWFGVEHARCFAALAHERSIAVITPRGIPARANVDLVALTAFVRTLKQAEKR